MSSRADHNFIKARETAFVRRAGWRQLLLAGCSALGLSLAVAVSHADAADGGRGGGGGSAGGAGDSLAGQNGTTSAHGGGGGASHPDGSGAGGDGHAGGAGGGAGAHGYTGDATGLPDAGILGAHGGDGRYDRDNGAGGGGGGGYGAVITPATGGALTIDQAVSGGEGGHGGSSRNGYGGGGGAGGAGLHFGGLTNDDLTLSGAVSGGHGGPSGTSAFEARGGDAGEAVRFTGGTLSVDGALTGGDGGLGGFGTGGGGDGGAGLLFEGTRLDLAGQVFGGHGGDGRNSAGAWAEEPGGFGGQGGAAVSAGSGGVITLAEGAEIRGGNGGQGGLGGVTGAHGAGGAGIVGADLTVVTAGSITGGRGGGGAQANAITFTGGTNRLELHDGYRFEGAVVANGAADTLAMGGGTDTSFAVGGIGSQYQGFEAFEKTGAHVLTLTGATDQTTPWTVRDGTLSVSADAQLGNAAGALRLDGGALAVTESFDSARRLTLAGDGDVAVHDGVIFDLAGILDGTGTLSKQGNGTFALSGDASGYQGGPLEIHDGTFLANAVTGGRNLDVVVADGAVLGGTGALGDVAVNAGGTYAPGTSIGVQKVGDVVFAAGSIYEVEVNDGGFTAGTNYDSIEADGTVAIEGGTVRVKPDNGTDNGSTYAPGSYTIVTADGGVTGVFDALEEDFVFLDMALDYDSEAIRVAISKARNLSNVAQTDNEQAVAGALEGSGNAVHDALMGLSGDDDAAREALNDLSGEGHATIQSALLKDSNIMRAAAIGRVRSAFRPESEWIPVDRGGGIVEYVPAEPYPYAAWAQTFGGWERINADGNAATLTGGTGGLLVGGETRAFDNILAGAMVGYAHSEHTIAEREMVGAVDSLYLGAYGGTQFDNIGLRFGGGYVRNAIETARTVAFTGFEDELSASYASNEFEGFAEIGYAFDLGATSFEPFANVSHVTLSTEGFTETGGPAALTSAQALHSGTSATVGIHGEHDMTVGTIPTTFKGSVGWQHTFGDLTPQARMRFAGDDTFAVGGAPVVSDALVLSYDAEFTVSPAATLNLGYDGHFGAGASEHILKATFGMDF